MSATEQPDPAWQASYPPGARWDQPIAPMTVTAVLDRALQRYPDVAFLDYAGRTVTYGEFGSLVDRLASGLAARGVAAGTKVALFLPNTPWHPIAFMALVRLGAVIVQVSALDARLELAQKLEDCGARLLITTDFPPMIAKADWLAGEGRLDALFVGEDTRFSGGPSMPTPPRWRHSSMPHRRPTRRARRPSRTTCSSCNTPAAPAACPRRPC